MDQTELSFFSFGRNQLSPDQVLGGEHTRRPEHSDTRITVLVWVAVLALIAAAGGQWRRYRTNRALRSLSAWQRADCGMDRPDIPTACELEAAACRRLANGMRADWS